ncbi:DNA adenine methylase (plasmid) [Nostoc sp. C052]|uniref:DNA adenine methylase n=1 Tax=Nostoc sp. C052 TaxID=2576902 RepID=UPI0015C402AA|nr:DNA adenine methylase [Nostoc sp. C052]QLE46412.1 DNA adenine methylase [Nostoc sp. C052]
MCAKAKLITTPLRYPGGKAKAIIAITTRLGSDFTEFREPFVGGGSIFIYLKQVIPDLKIWINDLNPEVYHFWQISQSNNAELVARIEQMKRETSDGKALYQQLIDIDVNAISNFDRAVRFFILNRITYGGTVESGGYSPTAFHTRFTDSAIARLQKVASILDGVKITNLDYQEVITSPGENVSIFADPPYLKATASKLYGKSGKWHTTFDHNRFARLMLSCPHSWLVTYDDSEQIRRNFASCAIAQEAFAVFDDIEDQTTIDARAIRPKAAFSTKLLIPMFLNKMNRPGNLRDFITTRITYNLISLLHKTDLNSFLGLRFDLSFCSKFAKGGCNCGDFYPTVAERIEHWEQHPQLRLGLADCAWVLGGGLLVWQKFKSKYAPQMPPPLIDENHKKSWSLDELKALVAKIDLTELAAIEAKAWAEFSQQVEKNQADWYNRVPGLLNLSAAELSLEKLKEIHYLHQQEKIAAWVEAIVDRRIPEYLNANYEDVWEFVKSEDNRKWLKAFDIESPRDLFGWQNFNDDETWDALNPNDSIQPTSTQNSLPTSLALKAIQVMQILSVLADSHEQSQMLMAEDAEKFELFNFIELYKKAHSLDSSSTIEIIATPDCSAQELHELILENCSKKYQINDIPKILARTRRLTWEVIKKKSGLLGTQTCLVVIAHAQNLSKSAIKEIEDLNVRCETSFLLAINTEDLDLPLFDMCEHLNAIELPPSELVEEIAASIDSLMSQDLNAYDAFQQIQSQTLSFAKRFDFN